MNGPLVTVGVPVYRGADMVAATLECLRTQTYQNLDVLISVDAADEATAEACRPFLADPRFRMSIQPVRLGWAGNTDWTMRQRRGDFYIYQQHDDTVSPDYVAALVTAAARWPSASICFSEMELRGPRTSLHRDPSLLGDPRSRGLAYLQQLNTSMFRGLMRGSALAGTSGLRIGEFDSFGSDLALMAELALAGEFRFVKGPLYVKNIHGRNVQLKFAAWPEATKRAAWACFGAWMAEIFVPLGTSVDERWRLFDRVLDRFLVARGLRTWPGFKPLFAQGQRMQQARPVKTSRTLRLLDRLRRSGHVDGWIRRRSRLTLCDIDNGDKAGRRELLVDILARLRSGGRFDPTMLDASWSEVADRATLRFVGP